MAEIVETIVQKAETFQRNAVESGEKVVSSTSLMDHFSHEWLSYLPAASRNPVLEELKQCLASGDFQKWGQLTRKWRSPDLFSLGEATTWLRYWKQLQSLTVSSSALLPLCCELLKWGRSLDHERLRASLNDIHESQGLHHIRKVLGILPYQGGALSLVWIGLSGKGQTPLHRHPCGFAETILEGKITEYVFKKGPDGLYRETHSQQVAEGETFFKDCPQGNPHRIAPMTPWVSSMAVFAGRQPVQMISDSAVTIRAPQERALEL